jgi:hypothetical protein
LVLQLLAAGILSIYILDEDKEGTSCLLITDFLVNRAIFDNGGDPGACPYQQFAME